MDTPIAISTQDLVKVFHTAHGELRAVDGVSLTVHPGETYGLIGPDGAGKSTTIRVILGLLKRTQGQSSVLGFDSQDSVAAHLRERGRLQAGLVPGRQADRLFLQSRE